MLCCLRSLTTVMHKSSRLLFENLTPRLQPTEFESGYAECHDATVQIAEGLVRRSQAKPDEAGLLLHLFTFGI